MHVHIHDWQIIQLEADDYKHEVIDEWIILRKKSKLFFRKWYHLEENMKAHSNN